MTGLGGRDVAANLAAGRSIRGQIHPGDDLTWTEGPTQRTGVVVAIHPVSVAVMTAERTTVHVPMRSLLEQPFEIRSADVMAPEEFTSEG